MRVNIEADSVNSAWLLPGEAPDSDAFELLAKEVAREMTVKSGQKCTAIRRVLVPEALYGAGGRGHRRALEEDHRRQPAQRDGAHGRAGQPRAAGHACAKAWPICRRRPRRCTTAPRHTLVDADPAIACCVGPTLLGARDPDAADRVHDTEVFGPVATLLPYRDTAHALALMRRGQGSLVASLYGSDPAALAATALELADSHGRVHVISPDVAALHTGHGNVMPQSLHGGPGRAGGGEELGGAARAELLPPAQRRAGQHRGAGRLACEETHHDHDVHLPIAPPAPASTSPSTCWRPTPQRAAKAAFIDDHGSLSYGQLDERVRRMAAGLRALGIKREERVLLLMQDCNDWPVSFLGAMYAGIVPVAVNTLLTADDYAYMLEHSRAQAVLVSGALLPALTTAMVKSDHEVQQGDRLAPGGAAAPGRSRVRGLCAGATRRWPSRPPPAPTTPASGSIRPAPPAAPRARCIRTPTRTGPASCTARRCWRCAKTTSAFRPPSCSSPTAWAMR